MGKIYFPTEVKNMDNGINKGVGCEVNDCKFNIAGTNCSLDKIHVGCSCGDKCTCCDSFTKRD